MQSKGRPISWLRRTGALAVTLLFMLGFAALSALAVADPGSGEAATGSLEDEQAPASQLIGLEPAFLTLINVSDTPRIARIELADGSGGIRLEFLAVDGVHTLELDEPFEPRDYLLSCTGCANVVFGLAAGQRLIVFVVATGDSLGRRSDVRIVNESGARQSGVLRTGSVIGEGRSVLRYDLRDGEEAAVGIRLRPFQLLDLNVTCNACLPHLIRVGNGGDWEIPLR